MNYASYNITYKLISYINFTAVEAKNSAFKAYRKDDVK